MTWQRAPDSEQACGHPRYVVESTCALDSTERLQQRCCLVCGHRWVCFGAERSARTNVILYGAPWRAA